MFVLSEIQDTISIHPSLFSKESSEAISEAINKKFSNKILQDVGLCICLFDILSAEEGKVRWGDGCLYHKVSFRLIVFRPFINEVLVGKIKSSDESGIRVSMGFFDDIHIPSHQLPQPSAFDHQERAFFWLYEARTKAIAEDPLLSSPEERMYLDDGEMIRFSVESDSFFDGEPGPAPTLDGQLVTESSSIVPNRDSKPHYSITCSIAGQGLGLVSWWAGAEADPAALEGQQDEEYGVDHGGDYEEQGEMHQEGQQEVEVH
ncbi:hypothetical protein IE53DRAFT_199673 [Violaceomyces palustris]|uniref:Uncharacterized protein n=1 Tax=Violaceomyces palustris TaxID=1673888 RepID=A0ACD0P5C9_9BASI|nr:hypothetical protein IE53DRAFT_199673 [Violaceomyces palustris]